VTSTMRHKKWPAILSSGILAGLLLASTAAAVPLPVRSYVHPLVGQRLTSNYGSRRHPIFKVIRNHTGMDLAAPVGSFVRAMTSGRVIFADPFQGYGNFVTILHGNGVTSHYGHLQQMRVHAGEAVRAGQIIGTVGNTGHSTGPHLHFEIRKNGEPLDPLIFLPGLTTEPAG
jgi:murein DD-endopeptidase MepM/ murein hydrolase activator NlpD